MDPSNAISNYMNMLLTCCFFSPIVPLALPLAFLSSLICYWTTKFMLLRKYKMPDMFGEFMATFYSNLVPYLMLAWAVAAWLFYYNIVRDSVKNNDLTAANEALSTG